MRRNDEHLSRMTSAYSAYNDELCDKYRFLKGACQSFDRLQGEQVIERGNYERQNLSYQEPTDSAVSQSVPVSREASKLVRIVDWFYSQPLHSVQRMICLAAFCRSLI
jgi:hypothetical protein